MLARAGALVRLSRRGLGPIVLRPPGDLGESLRHQRALRAVLGRDRDLLSEIRLTREAARAAQAEAELAAAALVERRSEQEKELERLRAARDGKEKRLARLRLRGEEQGRLVEELEDAAGRLHELIEKDRAPEPAGPRPAAEAWMCPLDDASGGVVRSRNGVEVPVASGSTIRAAAAGRVVFADWFPGYGKMIIVEHGGDLHSIYGYAEALLVRRGDRVAAGAPLGRAGSTGLASGARLYFEIREDGAPRDPGRFVPALAVRGAAN